MSRVLIEQAPRVSGGEFSRRDAVRQAEASIRLEGGSTSAERAQLNQRYIDGEIDIDSYLELSEELARLTASAGRSAANVR